MAKFTIKDMSFVVTVLSVAYDLSDHLNGLTLEINKDTPESTAMGSDWREHLGDGLKSYSISLDVQDDFAAGKTDAAIWAAFNSDTNPTWVLKPKSGAVSATNPSFSGSFVCPNYKFGGNVGDKAAKSVTFTGSGAVAKATS